MDKKVTMLMILDGVGINERTDGNAVALANTPVLDKILKTNPNTIIKTNFSKPLSLVFKNEKAPDKRKIK